MSKWVVGGKKAEIVYIWKSISIIYYIFSRYAEKAFWQNLAFISDQKIQ